MSIHMSTTTRLWRRITAPLGAVTLCVAVAGAAGAATTATSPKPTIVLVHGAFADSSGWSAEIKTLEDKGYPVIAAPDPLMGLTSDAVYVRSILKTVSGPIILVGHSYGGAVITNAARGVPNVKALVYVGAFVPAQGEATGTMLNPATYPGSMLTPQNLVLRPFSNPLAPGGKDLDVSINPAQFQAIFAGDISTSRAAVLAATQRPLSLFANLQKSGPPAWKSVPSWDLITLEDKAIPPTGQMFMAHRAGAHIETVHSAHDVMISHPSATVKIILDAVHGTN